MAVVVLVGNVVLLLLSTCHLATAGDYRHGKRRQPVPLEESFYNHQPGQLLAKSAMPKEFNWCKLDGQNYCASSWNQHIPQYCGACWLHGALSMVQDRIKVAKRGLGEDVMLSRQALLNCAAFKGYGHGCDGGDPIDVFRYMVQEGLPDEACMTYSATDHTKYGNVSSCPSIARCTNCMPLSATSEETKCWAVDTPLLYSLKSYYKVAAGVEGMMSEIMQHGPITCSMATPDDFVYNYRAGLYVDHSNSTVDDIDHDVEIVGWGEDSEGREYWHIRNSWGVYWGELGFFKLERSKNALWIEGDDCWAAIPDYSQEGKVLDGELQGSMYGLIPRTDSELFDPKQAPAAAQAAR